MKKTFADLSQLANQLLEAEQRAVESAKSMESAAHELRKAADDLAPIVHQTVKMLEARRNSWVRSLIVLVVSSAVMAFFNVGGIALTQAFFSSFLVNAGSSLAGQVCTTLFLFDLPGFC